MSEKFQRPNAKDFIKPEHNRRLPVAVKPVQIQPVYRQVAVQAAEPVQAPSGWISLAGGGLVLVVAFGALGGFSSNKVRPQPVAPPAYQRAATAAVVHDAPPIAPELQRQFTPFSFEQQETRLVREPISIDGITVDRGETLHIVSASEDGIVRVAFVRNGQEITSTVSQSTLEWKTQ